MLDPVIRAVLLSNPDIQVFNKPMSKDARRLLEDILTWGYGKTSSCFKVPNPGIIYIRAFIAEYKPIKFEEACHNYDMKPYVALINKLYKPNKVENLMNLVLLKNLDDESWLQSNTLKINHRVGSLQTDRAIELYNWLTTYYVMTDFTGFDLNKIVELSGEEFDLKTIKDEANKVTDSDKKNISYLYAIIRDVMSREQVVRTREKAMDSHYDERLKKVFSYCGPKTVYDNPDKTAEWERERMWIDAAKDMKKNDN